MVGISGKAPAGAADVKLKGYREEQTLRAVQSLQKFVGKAAEGAHDLLADEDEVFFLQLALRTMPLRTRKDKPVPLPLPHPLVSPEDAAICLFVKDHKGEGHKEGKAMVARYERKGGVAKVVGLSKLRTKYESHEAKRELCKLYDLFLADDRILPSLPKLIGKSFFKRKKQPIPVDIRVKDFPGQVRKACAATHMFKNSGTCINIKVARSSQTARQVADNIHAVLCQAVEHVPKKWANIQGVFLKTASSVALPLHQSLPEAKLRIDAAPSKPTAPSSSSKPAAPSSSSKPAAPSSSSKPTAPSSSSSKPAGSKQQTSTPGAGPASKKPRVSEAGAAAGGAAARATSSSSTPVAAAAAKAAPKLVSKGPTSTTATPRHKLSASKPGAGKPRAKA